MIPRIASFSFKKNTGTVSSVGLTVFSGLAVSGGPVTGSGTLAISTSLSGMVKGTGSGFAVAVAVAGTDYLAPSAIGSTVQGFSSQLASIAALATTSFGRGFLTQADASASRSTLGLVIGTHVQAYDSDLAAIAALSTTSFGRGLLTLADASALRGAMGPGLTVTTMESMTLTDSHHDATVTNYGATDVVTYTLDASAGTELLIVNETGRLIQLPPGSVDFLIDGAAGSLILSSSTFGDYIRLKRTNQYWVVLENRGFSASP